MSILDLNSWFLFDPFAPRVLAGMAPRTLKIKGDDDDILKPKIEKAKVTKTKADKTEKADKSKKDGKEKDKGDKVKPVTGDEAMKLIGEYLRTQNRPYSAIEVSANLHGKVSSLVLSCWRKVATDRDYRANALLTKVTKTLADRLLKEMEQNNEIMGKATNGDKKGSQWVFWALQVRRHF